MVAWSGELSKASKGYKVLFLDFFCSDFLWLFSLVALVKGRLVEFKGLAATV